MTFSHYYLLLKRRKSPPGKLGTECQECVYCQEERNSTEAFEKDAGTNFSAEQDGPDHEIANEKPVAA